MDYLGVEGMQAIVSGCMKNTGRLIAGMETFGIPRAATPDVNVATFTCTGTYPEPVEGLVDTTGTPADRLHAPCPRRPY